MIKNKVIERTTQSTESFLLRSGPMRAGAAGAAGAVPRGPGQRGGGPAQRVHCAILLRF